MSIQKQKRWEVLSEVGGNIDTEKILKILLANRGLKTKLDQEIFFNPPTPEKITLSELGINPKEVLKAIKRIEIAIKNNEKIIVYGDYDADGICGTAVMWECLYSLHSNVLPYIPERFSEGYGLNVESIKKLKIENPDLGLIVTVDHGIVAGEKVDLAKEIGVDVVITDHHTPTKNKSKGFAIIHSTKICGAAVAWIFAREVSKKINNEFILERLKEGLELVAIGTIADQMPLIEQNRSFAKYGLEKLNSTKRAGLRFLFEDSGIKTDSIGLYEIGYLVAPRINAMGRLKHGLTSLRLLCTRNIQKAKDLASELGKTNVERQKILEEIVVHAKTLMDGGIQEKIIVLAHESYHEGVIGLAAGKLVEQFYRPAIVISTKGEVAKASARSISGFNIIEAIRRVDSLILEGGGHPMAAGFSILPNKIEEFTKMINKLSVELLSEEILTRRVKIDLNISFDQITWELLSSIQKFAPTGIGNFAPVFLTCGVSIKVAKLVGKEKKHLSLILTSGEKEFKAIAFGMGEYYNSFTPETKLDVVYSIEEDTWGNDRKIQLMIKDLKESKNE